MLRRFCWVMALLLMHVMPAAAQELKPFVTGSIKAITSARQGKPFILGMWSLSCSHCREELAMLSALIKKRPDIDIVLVANDTPEEAGAIIATLRQFNLEGVQAWVFAESFAERLRYEIDPKWYGELPRTYLYDSSHKILAISGKLDPLRLEQWLNTHFPAR